MKTSKGDAMKRAAILSLCVYMLSCLTASSAQGQTFTVLYVFTGGADGGTPIAGLILDTSSVLSSNLYGTTAAGGDISGPYGLGTVFKVDSSGNETVLYTFTGYPDGAHPYAGLVRDAAGNFYGTTYGGGLFGLGTVFKLDKNGNEAVSHHFQGSPDGANPLASLILDTSSVLSRNLYGTTLDGGANYFGTVFKADTTGNETVLYSFGNLPDGAEPLYGGLVRDAAGNLYGTTVSGGADDYGTVFKVGKTGNETVLYSFTWGTSDGAAPQSGLIRDAAGNLYGTTYVGGNSASCDPPRGCGTVFKVDTTGNEAVLYSFNGGSDGANPYSGLVADNAGNLYGTTSSGGTYGYGTVFKLDATGNETVLHSFAGPTDGAVPYAGLVRDAAGNLYGTTSSGGSYGYGTVFKIGP